MKTVFINFQDGEIQSPQDVTINAIITFDRAFVDMTTYLNDHELGVLLQLQHHQTITTLHLTDVTPYVLLYFDEALIYKGAGYSLKSGSGCFTIHTPYKNILFVRLPHDLKLNQIINLNVNQNNISEDRKAEVLKRLNEEFPTTVHTGIGALYTTVRRMKAEKALNIPIAWRISSAISVETGKRRNEMNELQWNKFYKDLCENLKRDYPSMYDRLFSSINRP